MNRYVADTMALVLRLEKRRMPKISKAIFLQAEKGKTEIYIPAIVFAELAYLSEKNRIDTTLSAAIEYLNKHTFIKEYKLSALTIKHAFEIDDIPELHDRLVAASAKEINIPVITNDPAIHQSKFVKAIWGD